MKLNLFAAICFVLASNAYAETETFDVDPVHTRIAFIVSHAGFSNAIGTFSGSTGQLQFDENDWSQSSISVSIPVASLNLGDDGLLRSKGRKRDGLFANCRLRNRRLATNLGELI